MKKNEDASAFPWTIQEFEMSQPGLTKRELFAAMAMQGLLANREWADCSIHRTPDMKPAEVVIIEIATEAADFLIAELAKEPK